MKHDSQPYHNDKSSTRRSRLCTWDDTMAIKRYLLFALIVFLAVYRILLQRLEPYTVGYQSTPSEQTTIEQQSTDEAKIPTSQNATTRTRTTVLNLTEYQLKILRRRAIAAVIHRPCDFCGFDSIRFSPMDCWTRIEERYSGNRSVNYRHNDTALFEAMTAISTTVEHCSYCHPSNCTMKRGSPLRVDETGPSVLRSVMHVSLPVIPKERYSHTNRNISIPESDVQYSTYNPSIIHVPPALRDSLPDEAKTSAAYFCLFRVSGFGCLNTVPGHELLGVAVLDRNFQVLDGLNVVINLNKALNMRDDGLQFIDCRVFEVDGQLYLSSRRLLFPFDVSTSRNASVHTPFPNVYGDGLFMSHPPHVPRHQLRIKGGPTGGKNFQIFKTYNNTIMMQLYPVPHEYAQLQLRPFPHLKPHPIDPARPQPRLLNPGHSSFRNKDRGSACCIQLEREYYVDLLQLDGDKANKMIAELPYLLFGIAHIRSRHHTYVSRLYAFSPIEPDLAVVARSGQFCFPDDGSGDGGVASIQEPHRSILSNISLHIQNNVDDYTADCSKSQWVSGMVEVVDDPSQIVVGLGMDDCVSRFVVVRKRDVAVHLFTNLGTYKNVPYPPL